MPTVEPRIEQSNEKKLVGCQVQMSLVNNLTKELWSSFMPLRNLISNRVGDDLYNLQVYEFGHYESFNPAKEFQAWALAVVEDFKSIPKEMEGFTLPPGDYAVFIHKGGPATASETMQYIFTKWLPSSGYLLDNRPHFEVLGAKYSNNDPESEEEIWIPICQAKA